MATVVRMPEVLTGSAEASLVTWHVAVGDDVEVGQALAEMETEKAVVDCVTEEAGRVALLLVELNEPVATGVPIVLLAVGGESIEDAVAHHGAGPELEDSAVVEGAPVAESAPAAALRSNHQQGVSTGVAGEPTAAHGVPAVTEGSEDQQPAPVTAEPDPADTDPPETDTAETGIRAAEGATASGSPDRRFATPLVRKLARERGLDLAEVPGSGPQGRITRRDLERVDARPSIEQQPVASSAPAPADAAQHEPVAIPAAPRKLESDAGQDYVDIPHSGMRRAIARRLVESKSSVPHFYLVADCHVDALIELRRALNAQTGVKVSLNDFVVKAVAGAFGDVPEANVIWTTEATRQFSTVSLAVAVAIEGGLLTPVLHDVDQRSVSNVSRSLAELVGRAREGRLKQSELEGGSFTVSNLGMFGIERFSAIINPPHSGILAVGAASKRPVVGDDGALTAATMMTVTLSGDHRALDGALAARWLAAFQHRVEHPMTILA